MTDPAPSTDAKENARSEREEKALEEHDYSRYLLYSRSEILFVLRSIVQKKCMLTVHFDSGRAFFLTALLSISEDGQWLYFDMGSEEDINRRALLTDRLMLTAILDRVKIQFSLKKADVVDYNGRKAFASRLPETLLRLQRREHFRLATPIAEPVKCTMEIALPQGGTTKQELTILDISGGGVGLKVADIDASAFLVGTLFNGCQIVLPPEPEPIITGLCVRNALNTASKTGTQYLRVGCEYVELPGTALTLVQRYIIRVERERRARERGLE